MFDNLIESKAKKKKQLGQTVTSMVIHGVLIVGAIKATSGIAKEMENAPVDTTMVFLKAAVPPPPPTPPPPQDVVVSANPPPKGFQTVVAPTDIPKDIPPVDLNQKPFDARNFTGTGAEGGVATGIVGGTGPVDVGSVVVTSAEADDPPRMITPGPQRTPAGFEGVPGRATIVFIVDTLGRAEPNSVKVEASTNRVFDEPAKDVVLKAIFKPGHNGGRSVRVLVKQAIVFGQ